VTHSNVRSLGLALIAALSFARSAAAQLSYVTDYTTTASLGCRPIYLTWKEETGTCDSDGKTVWITSSLGQTLTVSFSGVTAPLTPSLALQPVLLGTITTTLTGPGSFAFPEASFPYNAARASWIPFQFGALVGVTTGGQSHAVGFARWASVQPTLLSPYPESIFGQFFDTPINGYKLVFSNFNTTWMYAGNTSINIFGTAALFAPEPSTFILTGTGLVGLLLITLRKHRSSSHWRS
jgi:hypothetical protein